MTEKYTYYEVGQGDTWHIWYNEVRVLKDNFFFCLASSVEDAEYICKTLNENEARKNMPKTEKELLERIKILERVIDAKDEILVAYRLGKMPSDKALDLLQKFKEENYYETNNQTRNRITKTD